jgi:hypothetical protein
VAVQARSSSASSSSNGSRVVATRASSKTIRTPNHLRFLRNKALKILSEESDSSWKQLVLRGCKQNKRSLRRQRPSKKCSISRDDGRVRCFQSIHLMIAYAAAAPAEEVEVRGAAGVFLSSSTLQAQGVCRRHPCVGLVFTAADGMGFCDKVRILRAPGSLNHKEKYGAPLPVFVSS